MRAWTELKRILNTEKDISRTMLVDKLYKETKVNAITLYRYLDLLELSKYINMYYKPLGNYILNIRYKLIKKIPEKLTGRDIEKMRQMPWLSWFKYPNG